jgi:hypothetical protein
VRGRRVQLAGFATASVVIATCTTNATRKSEGQRPVSPTAEQSELACAPVAGALSADARAESLAGTFRLVLIATSGQRTGRSARGKLDLQRFAGGSPPNSSVASANNVLFGSASVTLDSIGATAPGAIGSADQSRPGVLVIEWFGANAGVPSREITLRFGADANRGEARPFDGTHMALFVNSIVPTRFAGKWDSGAGSIQASGYFCAERSGPP